MTMYLTDPEKLAPKLFASGVPTVRTLELRSGGAQEANASDGPCVRLDEVHC
jgi:hypothetical protein